MASPPRRGTSRKDWEEQKAEIYELYLRQNLPLNLVTEFLNDQRGFQVTPRQVKAKIKEWSFDNKRTFGHHYRAMLVVADHRRNNLGLDTVFMVPKNASVEEVCPARVKKEVDRQKGELRSRLPSLQEAETVLKAGNIAVHLPWTENTSGSFHIQTPNQNHSNGNLNPSADGQWVMDDEADDADSSTENGNFLSISQLDLTTGPPVASLEISHTSMESFANRAKMRLHIGQDTPQHSPQIHMQPAIAPGGPPTIAYAFRGLNFDFWNANADQYWCTADEPKMFVSQWASPWLLHAFGSQIGQQTSKADGIDALKRMLSEQRDNQYILPCLSWMITILGAYGKRAELHEFLSASCHVVDEVTGRDPMYISTFHYALAAHQKNNVNKRKYGENLARFHEAMKLVWGEDHPNILVNVSFWAWYLLDEQKFEQAIQLLESNLPFFENVMGRHDLLTVNGRAILSRAYRATGDCSQAIYQLEQALQFLGNDRQELSAVGLELHGKLGILLFQAREFLRAESHLRHCIIGSVQIFGLQDRSLWYHINLLCKILCGRNRFEEAAQLLQSLQQHADCPQSELGEVRDRVNYECWLWEERTSDREMAL